MSSKKSPVDAERQARILKELRQAAMLRQQGYRERALKLFPHVCASCGREFSGRRLRELTVHHKDRNFKNNPPDGSNWELLCLFCHDHEHEKFKMVDYYGGTMPENEPAAPAISTPFEGLDELITPVREDSNARGIPYYVMRGGTSKALFFMKKDLPDDITSRDRILLDILGLAELRDKAGMGLDSLSSKIAIISPSSAKDADVDYFFAQGDLKKQVVDTSVSCGNILSAVGPFAIETGLVKAACGETTVGVLSVNTNVLSQVIVQTPQGVARYDGDTHIDGVEGTAAPVLINFLNSEGSTTGKVLPTGNASDIVEGIEVSCVDAAMPVVIASAADFGKNGHEKPSELNADAAMLAKLETVRRSAGRLMGLGDVSKLVMPKFALVSPPVGTSGICSRYFTPAAAHTSHAVTGALCVAAACHIPGTVAAKIFRPPTGSGKKVVIEHPAGVIEAEMDIRSGPSGITIPKAAFIRTASMLIKDARHVC